MYRADLQKVKCVWPHKHSDQSSDCKNCQTGHIFKKGKMTLVKQGLACGRTNCIYSKKKTKLE